MEEIWKDIPGWEGKYQASTSGRVKSLFYHNTNEEHIMCPSDNGGGYLSLSLYRNNKQHSYYVHRIVWETFNGPIPNGFEINHINEDTHDNRLFSLSLLTPKENANYGTRNERSANNRRGKPQPKRKQV